MGPLPVVAKGTIYHVATATQATKAVQAKGRIFGLPPEDRARTGPRKELRSKVKRLGGKKTWEPHGKLIKDLPKVVAASRKKHALRQKQQGPLIELTTRRGTQLERNSHPTRTECDRTAASSIGARGVKLLPFFQYGGRIGSIPPGADWSVSNFGTLKFNIVFRAAIETHQQHDIATEFTLGTNRGQGVCPRAPTTKAYSGI
ncbi:hypothetical protein GGTG_04584 [Gaeumannomyces tritici R3-111a-1]|uniref:Uncharacterized protein n=1 Tax=Gaeumannomyces tritici (strain R3-111a-1) TaxID=644352 RepID=J3NTI4_GAET3|nr:hypothetical protein GGTG_04584 [Gaeumannomyces tritici R3-111a-1]EJT79500.1 hypothetical protein GGTG_04584 [Gaeumannomyces tritici R3-111a-1]